MKLLEICRLPNGNTSLHGKSALRRILSIAKDIKTRSDNKFYFIEFAIDTNSSKCRGYSLFRTLDYDDLSYIDRLPHMYKKVFNDSIYQVDDELSKKLVLI